MVAFDYDIVVSCVRVAWNIDPCIYCDVLLYVKVGRYWNVHGLIHWWKSDDEFNRHIDGVFSIELHCLAIFALNKEGCGSPARCPYLRLLSQVLWLSIR